MIRAALWPWLLALPLPWLLARLPSRLPGRPPREAAWLHPDAALLARLAGDRPDPARRWALLGCSLLVLALARPQWTGPLPPALASAAGLPGGALVVAMDVSGSMRTRDVPGPGGLRSRLGAARELVEGLLALRPADRVGLVAFGEEAYLLLPPTRDHALLERLLGQLRPGMAGERTALGDALALAARHLAAQPPEGRSLLLLSDGTSTAGRLRPEEALEALRRAGVRVYTVAVGRREGLYPRGPLEGPALVRRPPDLALLRRLARATGGEAFRLGEAGAARAVAARIGAREAAAEARRHPLELYPLPLAAGLALLLAARLRRLGELPPPSPRPHP